MGGAFVKCYAPTNLSQAGPAAILLERIRGSTKGHEPSAAPAAA
jgi:hypothetical protein